jgi:hypothetical protein
MSLSSASLGICIIAKTLAVDEFSKGRGPRKSGSKAAASTASTTFHVGNPDVKESTPGPGEAVELNRELEEWPASEDEFFFDRSDTNISSNPPSSSSREGKGAERELDEKLERELEERALLTLLWLE